MIAPLIPVMYLDSTTDAMLKGLGEQFYSMNVNIIDALISVALVWFLLPIYGIEGYIFIIFLMEVLNFGLSASRLMLKTGLRPRIFKWVVKPLVCAISSSLIGKFVFTFSAFSLGGAAGLVLRICTVLTVYIILIVLTQALDREDTRWIIGIFKKDQ